MKMSATKEQIAVRRQAVADFKASAPERNVWEQSVYAALRSEWDEGGAIKAKIKGLSCENAVRAVLGEILDEINGDAK